MKTIFIKIEIYIFYEKVHLYGAYQQIFVCFNRY